MAAILSAGLLLGACEQVYQRGYVLPEGALEQIPVGSSQEQVLVVLGTPSTVATVSGEATKALGDIRRDGYRRPPHLHRQSVRLLLGECRCERVNRQHKLVSFLPNDQIAKASGRS
jgi:hypothetical protein